VLHVVTLVGDELKNHPGREGPDAI